MDNQHERFVQLKLMWGILWDWLSRPFLTCDGNRCGGYIKPQFLFKQDDEGLHPIVVKDDGWEYTIYVYYCPWCGRKMRPNNANEAEE